jgi:hypothetical protein
MKKLILAAATCSLLLGIASCAKETVESAKDGKGAMSFEAAMKKQKQTRVKETTIASLQADAGAQLDVLAYRAGENTQWGSTFVLKYDSGANEWGYGTPVYQPGFMLRYYSVYPTTSLTTPTAGTDDYTFGYTVNDVVASQQDLIGAYVPATIDSDIKLQYNHLLSQVNFAAQAIQDVKIVISNLALVKIGNTATYSFKGTGAGAAWGTVTGEGNYTYSLDPTALGTLAGGQSSAVVALGDGGDKANALMLMPQTFTAATDGSDYFTFDYVVTIDSNNDDDFEDAPVDVVKSGAAKVLFGDFQPNTWVAGKRYLYVIDFTPLLTGGPIKFTVDVTAWNDATTTNNVAETIEVADVNEHSLGAAINLLSEAKANDANLTVFPITIPGTIATGFTVPTIYGFAAGDVIRIQTTSTDQITFSQTGWSSAVTAGVEVALTCTKPTVKGTSGTVNLTDVDNDTKLVTAIETAITALGADVNTDAYKEYTVNVGKDFEAAGSTISPAGNYATGDVLRLIFPNTDANNLVTATGWTGGVADGAAVVLTKE